MAVALGNSTVVTVFGGSGFLGRYVVQALARTGCRIKVAVRRPDLALDVQPLGTVGQIMPIQANLRDDASVKRALVGSHAAINLVGILQPSGKQKFRAIHAEGAERVAKTALAVGATSLIHVSAIGADRISPSAYARTKADGEMRVLAAFPEAIILRPSIIFGPEDHFFNRFAAMARIFPVLPLIGGRTRFQPIFAGDVGQAVAAALSGRAREGAIYELGGPGIYTFKRLMQLICEWTQHPRPLFPIPFSIAKIPAFFLQWLPFAPVTLDQLRLLQHDNIVSEQAIQEGRVLENLGVEARSVELIVPSYLARFRPKGEFSPRSSAMI